jgi:hypothetical protein
MIISGFTIIRNAVMNDYPILEAIHSILPMVDEMIVLVGDSSDGTLALIESIHDEKIKIHHSVWDTAQSKGGSILAVETNKALQYVNPDSDWLFYIQGDEVIHEKYYGSILQGCEAYKNDQRVEGLLFKYLHFYGTYDYVGDSRTWYSHEVRIIRHDTNIKAYRDAQGFRKNNEKLNVKQIDAYVFHYGWVKSPEQMQQKRKNVAGFWNIEAIMEKEPDFFDFTQFDSIEKFMDTHPAVMQERISNKNFHIELDFQKKKFSFKDKLLYWVEKMTGIRLFDFKNYRILK